MHCRLCRLCLLLSVHIRHERNVYEREILMTDAELELPHCLYERCGLNIANRSTELVIKVSRKGST